MGSTPKAPTAPDPATTAAAQTSTNKDTALYNAVLGNANQVTPYGNINYTQGPTTYNNQAYNDALSAYNTHHKSSDKLPTLSDYANAPQFTATTTLSPDQQKLLDTSQKNDLSVQDLGTQQIGRIANAVNTPYSYSGLGDAPSQQDIATASQQGQDAIMSRLNPQFDQDEEKLRTRLINQGIGQGSQAYSREFQTLEQAKNDARQQAVLGGAQYGGDLQNQALQRRSQAISEYDAQRNAPLNEYTALTSGQQIQNPTAANYSGAQSAATNYSQLAQNAYQGQLNNYNQQVGSNNATTSGLFGLGGAAASGFLGSSAGSSALAGLFAMSDERAKENIKGIGQENGHNIYEFNYIGKPQKYTGVMAQEVEITHPKAVIEIDGVKHVNYHMIGVTMKEVG